MGIRRGVSVICSVLAGACLTAGIASAADRHIDCQSLAGPADGSAAAPWTTLAEASADPLEPGDRVLLKRGTICTGTLSLSGAGSIAAPAAVEPYGPGDARPLIEGAGEDALLLDETSHLTVRGLELTNHGDHTGRKRGIHVVTDGTTVTGLTIAGNHIHDVEGDLAKDGGGSGGIQVDSAGGPSGHFERLSIEDNLIERVSRSGIFINGLGGGVRPRSGQPWPEASQEVRVTGNRIDQIAGDGIVTLGTDRARLDHNVVSHGNLAGRPIADPAGMICNAGIWAFNANGTVIEHNEVFGMEFNGCDGSGFDVDYMQDGTIIQFNYSHDNEGGFLLLCTDSQPRTSTVRFNFSLNDGLLLNSSPCNEPTGDYSGIEIYNNTAVSPDPAFAILGYPGPTLYAPFGSGPPTLDFFNNIVAATGPSPGFTCDGCRRNLFHGLPPAGADPISGDPLFTAPSGIAGPDAAAGYRLKAGSPASRTGVPIPDSVTVDYFGQARPSLEHPNLGFDLLGAPVPPPEPPPDTAAPKLSRLKLKPARLRARPGRGPAFARRGSRLSFRLDAAARVEFAVRRAGRPRVRGRITVRAAAGTTRKHFTGRIGGRPLAPGNYRLTATPRGVNGTGAPVSLKFRILKPRR